MTIRRTMVCSAALAGGLLLVAGRAQAQFVKIENAKASPRDGKTAALSFDLSWKDSWRHEFNHDALWVFVKVKPAGQTAWQHLRLAADRIFNPSGYGQAGGRRLEFLAPAGEDGFTGVFIRRAEFGQGTLSATGVTVIGDLDSVKDPGKLEAAAVKILGIPMVYIPEGAFCVGSGGSEPNGFYGYTDGKQDTQPFRVTGSGAIPTGRQQGRLWARGAEPEDGGEIPGAFPNGHAAFYCMKYQITPWEYAAFLNTLAAEEAARRYPGPERRGSSRVGYSGTCGSVSRDEKAAGDRYAGHPGGARGGPGCFALSWADGATFAAWAGLRPMTELELEKAVRGPRDPIPHEVGPSFWGLHGFATADWFAYKGDPQSERPVTVANAAGRRFSGTHGRGTTALPPDWPQADAVGSGMRCTHYAAESLNLRCTRLSDRLLAATADPSPLFSHKWRGVRTAPREAATTADGRTPPELPMTASAVATNEPVAGLPPAALGEWGPGLKVENVTVAPRDATTAMVMFDLSWQNSWRHGSFHDAVWVFFKARAKGADEWRPVRLAADRVLNPTGYGRQDGTPLEFIVPAGAEPGGAGVGMFVRRAAEGKGAVAAQGVTAMAALTAEAADEIRAFAIEMACVAEGPYWLGSISAMLNYFYLAEGQLEIPPYRFGETKPPEVPLRYEGREAVNPGVGAMSHDYGQKTRPYLVIGPGAVPTGRQEGRLWAAGLRPEDGGELPAAFPNGYAAFYCMKVPYFTQAIYAGFLNTLTVAPAVRLWSPDYQGVAIKRSGNAPNHVYEATAPGERCPWLSWTDNAALTAWAGLRPMTELEFEKAIRGHQMPAPGWDAPLSFWGLLDINTGGLYERCVSAGSAAGRRFAGTHGNGTPELPADWPLHDGVVYRGDYLHGIMTHMLTSGRMHAMDVFADRDELPFAGWRAARTAPAGVGAPVLPRFADGAKTPLPRLGAKAGIAGVPEGWGAPLAALEDAGDVYPVQNRFAPNEHTQTPWRGTEDASGKVYLAWDGDAVCIGAVVTDDTHFNNKAGGELWNGDAIQFGLVNPKGVHFNAGLALTTNGAAMHQFMGEGDAVVKTAERSVARDEAAKLTRYGLRLPLTSVGLKPGDEFAFNIMVIDGDDAKGMRHNLQLAPGIAYPFRPELYPRFILKE